MKQLASAPVLMNSKELGETVMAALGEDYSPSRARAQSSIIDRGNLPSAGTETFFLERALVELPLSEDE